MSQVVLMTWTTTPQRLPMLASACASNGGTSLPTIAQLSLGGDVLKTRKPGHVIGGVSPVAAQRPQTVLNQEQIQVQDPRGGYAEKPEFMSTKVDGLRGVPPRGRPV
ncbi:MAG: hypothetical protein HOV71_30540 [Hamadaea sp.]|nr:hypothetical protein [Hamadaea sp.]NUR52486.1 hypothetical protein [Hamadaea sp.]NUT02897.1 hypothetical protein [Hamadaea sp.]